MIRLTNTEKPNGLVEVEVPSSGTDHLSDTDKYDALMIRGSYLRSKLAYEAERERLWYVLHRLSQSYSLRVIARDLDMSLANVQRMVSRINGQPPSEATG